MKLFLCWVLLICGAGALGHWMMPPHRDVPITRLIANLTKQAKERPNDAEVNYELGRLHSMAFARTKKVSYYGTPGKDFGLHPSDRIQVPMPVRSKLDATELDHLLKSLSHYRAATQLDPKEELAQLGLAYMYEVTIPFAEQLPKAVYSGKSSQQWKQESLELYRSIYKRNREKDAANDGGVSRVRDQFMSQEAGESILRVGWETIASEEKKDIELLLKTIEDKHRAVTPIIFPLGKATAFADLVDNRASVAFDLAGDGVKRRWPWVRPNAGFLVWDPRATGKVTSGQQLFGSATFWMFYRDGYAALASLDNDGNGRLTGAEMVGIAVWHDRNSNGSSDPGEVRPLSAYGVAAIQTRGSSVRGILSAQRGIVFADGRTLPTYDWVPTSRAIVTPGVRISHDPSQNPTRKDRRRVVNRGAKL